MNEELMQNLSGQLDLIQAATRQLADTAVLGTVVSPIFQILKQILPKGAKKWHVRTALLTLITGSIMGYAQFKGHNLSDPINLFWVAWTYAVASWAYDNTSKDSTQKRSSK